MQLCSATPRGWRLMRFSVAHKGQRYGLNRHPLKPWATPAFSESRTRTSGPRRYPTRAREASCIGREKLAGWVAVGTGAGGPRTTAPPSRGVAKRGMRKAPKATLGRHPKMRATCTEVADEDSSAICGQTVSCCQGACSARHSCRVERPRRNPPLSPPVPLPAAGEGKVNGCTEAF